MPISSEAMKVVVAFQNYQETGNKPQIENYSLEELRQTNYQLGDRDANTGWRLAILERISELEKDNEKLSERKHQSKIRAWQLIVGIIAALVIAGLAKILFGT